MSAKHYKIVVKGKAGINITGYRSKEKLKVGEELMLFYKNENHLIKVTSLSKGAMPIAEAEEA